MKKNEVNSSAGVQSITATRRRPLSGSSIYYDHAVLFWVRDGLLHPKYRAAQVTNTGNSKIKRSKTETKQNKKTNVVIIHLTDAANVLKMLSPSQRRR